VLARVTPDVPVTTNFMGLFEPLDYWAWAAREDVVSHDAYPDPEDPVSHVDAALAPTSCAPCADGSRGCSWSRRRAR
jgi:beta-galactosidase